MPALLERPKMTRAMYEALKRHIMREREKKKQEQEQDALMERLKKEQEMRKKKEEEDSQTTLEMTNEQILQLEKKLEELKDQKKELFSQLKKVLHQDETRRRAQQKEQSELTMSQPTYQRMAPAPQPMMMHGRPALYKPTAPAPIMTTIPQTLKRQRSPTPPPVSSVTSYQSYGHSEAKYAHSSEAKYPHGEVKYSSHADSKFVHSDPKYLATYGGTKAGPPGHLYTAQHAQGPDFKSSAYQQPGTSHIYATSQSFQQQAAAVAANSYSSSQSTASKYPGPGQSAFRSYPSHYPQKALAEQFSSAYPIQRMQQPGYPATLQLQQTLEHAGQKQTGFEDKYKLGQSQIRGMVPPQQPALLSQALQIQQQQQQQQQAKSSSAFVPGYPPQSQAGAPPGSSYPTPTSSGSGQGRTGYSGQSHGRYY